MKIKVSFFLSFFLSLSHFNILFPIEKILQASVDLFSDTIDDFKNISVIKSKLEDWKFNFSQVFFFFPKMYQTKYKI